MTPSEFVKEYYRYAKQSEGKTGIDARFTLAQAALETGWAKSVKGNMFFGIKANTDTPMEDKQLLVTREVLSSNSVQFPEIIGIKQRVDGKYDYVVKDWFRKYDTPEGSFTDHSHFFFNNKRYAKALEVRHNPNLFAEEVDKAGYATDPNYANSLKSVIRTIEKHIL